MIYLILIGGGERREWPFIDIEHSFLLAVGCKMFADGSSLIILNKTKCDEPSECSGKKEIDLTRTWHGCSMLPNKTQYLHNDTWRALEVKNGSFEITPGQPFLKVFQTLLRTKVKEIR